MHIKSDGTKKWGSRFWLDANLTSFLTANYLLSFGETRNDVLSVWTNENKTTPSLIFLGYLKNIDLSSTLGPRNSRSNADFFQIGVAGKYLVKGLIDDP